MKRTGERVAVTGLGAITALGQSATRTFAGLVQGEAGIGELSELEVPLAPSPVVAEVKGLHIGDIAPAGQAGIYSRADALAAVAAGEALAQAGVENIDVALAIGTTGGGVREATRWLMDRNPGRLDAALAQKLIAYPLHATAARLAERFGNIRRHATFCSACSSGATAIVQAALWVSTGQCACALAGGAESLSLLTLTGFTALGATSRDACRPFDVTRSGMTLGEGAAFLILEGEAHARARGAPVLAWLDGWSLGAEAHHITHPDPTGQPAARLLDDAMQRAGVAGAEVGYYNAHGTGTVPNDSMEANALRLAFGADTERVLVSSSKGQLGHTLGAAGAIEAVATVLALQHQIAPPTVGLSVPAPDTQLNHVIGSSRRFESRHAISSSFGFGGLNVVLLFSHLDSRLPEREFSDARVVITACAGQSIQPRSISTSAAGDASCAASEQATDPLHALDPERSRRFDRLSAVACSGAERALAAAGIRGARAGMVVGNALGNTNRLCAALERVKARGGRGMAPAEFPHLVHSALAGNTSIYGSFTGPTATVSDDGLCCATAFVLACGLVQGRLAEVMVTGVAEAIDDGAETILDAYASPRPRQARESDLSQWFVLESEDHALKRKHTALARVVESRVTVGPWYQYLLQRRAPEPRSSACLILAGIDSAALDRVPAIAADWRAIARFEVPRGSNFPSGSSGVALLRALDMLGNHRFDHVQVLSKWGARTWALCVQSAAPNGETQREPRL